MKISTPSLLGFVLLATPYFLQAQSVTETELIGSWEVTSVDLLPFPEGSVTPEMEADVKRYAAQFDGIVLHFRSNHTCTIDVPNGSVLKDIMDSPLKDLTWSLNGPQGLVSVGNVMKITIRKKGGKVIFWVMDSPILLNVVPKE